METLARVGHIVSECLHSGITTIVGHQMLLRSRRSKSAEGMVIKCIGLFGIILDVVLLLACGRR